MKTKVLLTILFLNKSFCQKSEIELPNIDIAQEIADDEPYLSIYVNKI